MLAVTRAGSEAVAALIAEQSARLAAAAARAEQTALDDAAARTRPGLHQI